MLDFEFHNPTHIVFGQGQIARLATLVPASARVALLYGGDSARRHGTLDEVVSALAPRHVETFGGIEPNPAFQTLMEAVMLIRQHDLDYIIAIGGGSVIDGAKFVALAVNCDSDPWQAVVVDNARDIEHAVPLACVLTLPATGSEMNPHAVITRYETREKLAFSSPLAYPQFSILDPTRAYTLSSGQLANGVVDAFTHVMEQYLTYPVNAPVQDRFAEGLLLTLVEIGPALLASPRNYELQASFMWAATLALNGLIGAGVPQDWSTHMIGHELTALHGLDHAQTLATLLPSVMQARRQAKHDKLLQYAARIWGIHSGDDASRIEAAIDATRRFFESLGMKTRLGDYGIAAVDIPAIVARLERHGLIALGEHGDIDVDASRAILQASL